MKRIRMQVIKIMILLGVLVCPWKALYAQTVVHEWVNTYGCLSGAAAKVNEGIGIAVDGSGNTYTVGNFSDTTDFDPGSGNAVLLPAGHLTGYAEDIFVLKQDPAGQFLWVKQFGGVGCQGNRGFSVAADEDGNVYITGGFCGSVDFDPGPGSFVMQSALGNFFLLKLNAAGDFVFARQWALKRVTVVRLDKTGNIYLSGEFTGLVDFDPGPGNAYLYAGAYNNATRSNIFTLKLDPAGAYVWAKNVGAVRGTHRERGMDVAIDRNGNVFTYGHYGDSVDFDPGPGSFYLYMPYTFCCSFYNVFVQKLDSNGRFQWVKSFYSDRTQRAAGMVLDSEDNIYIAGDFNGDTDVDTGPGREWLRTDGVFNGFIAKLDTRGQKLWVRKIGASVGEVQSQSLSIDRSDNIYLTGTYSGHLFFADSQISLKASGERSSDIFLLKVNREGVFSWMKTIGEYGALYTGRRDNIGRAVALDASDNIYLTGLFEDTVDFDPGPGADMRAARNAADAFVQKFSQHPCPPMGRSLEVISCGPYVFNQDTFRRSGLYKYSLKSAESCDSVLSLMLTIHDISAAVEREGDMLTASADSAGYQWLDCDRGYAEIAGAVSRSYIASDDGRYAVQVSKNGCLDTSSCVKLMNTAAGDLTREDAEVRAVPNPSRGVFTVKSSLLEPGVRIRIADAMGRIVREDKVVEAGFLIADLSGQPDGIYIAEIFSGQIMPVRIKMLKQ